MIRSKNEIEDVLLLKTKTCETLIEQTHRKPQEILEFKPTKTRKNFSFKPSINFGIASKIQRWKSRMEKKI